MAQRTTKRPNNLWTDNELRQSVEVYVLLLRFQIQGANNRSEPLVQALLGQSLAQRNEAAIRYRMRNISAVVQELGAPILNDFTPAESVGRLVRPKIKAMLLENTEFARILNPSRSAGTDATSNALSALRILRNHIEELAGIRMEGHNGPPDGEDYNAERDQLRNALDDIMAIEGALERPSPDKELVKSLTEKLLGLAAIFGKWLSARATKFVDAALVLAAPVAVAKVADLLPVLANAVEALSKVIAH